MPDQRALADFLRLGSAQREDALLQAQMQQAAQMAQPRGRVYGTAGGAIMGGLSDGLREMAGGFRQQGLQRDAERAESGRVDARQQWLSAALRGQPPPADALPPEPSPQEQAAGMATALRGEPAPDAAAPDALTTLAPYQAGPLLGGGAAPSGTPAAPLAPLSGQAAGPGAALRAKVSAPAQSAAGAPGISSTPEPMASAPAVATERAGEEPQLSPEQYAEIAIASGDPAMMAWGKTVLEQANLREAMNAKRQEGDAKAKADKAKTETDLRDYAAQQRDRFEKLPEWREAQTARTALDIIEREGTRGTAFGDMSMIYALVTGYDPKSGVKEGEFNAAAAAQGIPDRVVNAFYQAKSGVKLGPDQRADMIEAARNSFRARAAPALQRYQEYAGYLDQAGLGEPEKHLPDIKRFMVLPKAPKSAKASKGAQQDVSKLSDDELKRIAEGGE